MKQVLLDLLINNNKSIKRMSVIVLLVKGGINVIFNWPTTLCEAVYIL